MITSKVQIIGFLLLFFLSNQSFSQYIYPDQDLCEELKQRTLLVQLLDETDEASKALNNALRDEFEAWNLCPVEFKSNAQVEEILNSRNTKYAVLTQDNAVQKDIRSRNVDQNGKLIIGSGTEDGVFKQFYTAFSFSYYNFDLLLPTGKKKPETITSITFANPELSRIDYLYLVQQLNRLIESSLVGTKSGDYMDPESNVSKIEKSKLIFLKDFFKEKEIGDISKYYESPYELVDMERYQEVILEKEPGLCYAKIIWSNQINMYIWVVVNAADGQILAQQSFGGVKFGSSHDADDIIKVKHLKYVTNVKAQKFNNKY